ncbi:MAG: DUF484 family protein, partial [Pseudomonadales bacterium]
TQSQYSIDADFYQDSSDAEQTISGIVNNNQSLCGSLRESEAEFIFTNTKYAIGSAAIASKKIERSSGSGADIIVMLAVAHHNADHYNSDTGTLFLDYLCDILTALVQRQLS